MPTDHHGAARRKWLADMQQRSSHLEEQRQKAIHWLRTQSKRGYLLDNPQSKLSAPRSF